MLNELKKSLLENLESGNWTLSDLTRSLKDELRKNVPTYHDEPLSINASNYFLQTDFNPEKMYAGTGFPILPSPANNSTGIFDFFLAQLKYKGQELALEISYLDDARRNHLFKTFDKIKAHYPWFQTTVDELNLIICFFKGASFLSTSNPKILGTIFINESIFETAEELDVTIIHELAHQELFLLNMIDLLIDKDMIHNLSHARFQGYQRPPIGRFHSLHSIYRMTKYSELSIHPLFSHLKKDFFNAIEDLQSEELSFFGKEMYSRVYETYAKSLAEVQ